MIIKPLISTPVVPDSKKPFISMFAPLKIAPVPLGGVS
jgi:hypothetical protein